jgi:flavodoxin
MWRRLMQQLTRRASFSALAMFSLGSASPAPRPRASERRRGDERTLVAYFSRSGNTRVIAGMLQRKLGARLFEIRAARPYPDDYLETVALAQQERDGGQQPPLLERAPSLADVETVYLGFPIWGETTPPLIRTFLSTHDLAGKALIPFVTHGGFGLGNSLSVLASHAPMARLQSALVLESDQERRTMNLVNEWLSNSEPRRTP